MMSIEIMVNGKVLPADNLAVVLFFFACGIFACGTWLVRMWRAVEIPDYEELEDKIEQSKGE